MDSRRIWMSFGFVYGIKVLVSVLVAVLFLMFRSNFLFLGGNTGYFVLSHLADFSFNSGFVFIIVLFTLFWKEIKEDIILRVISIVTSTSMMTLFVSGVIIGIDFYRHPLNTLDVFGIGGTIFLANYVFMFFILSFITLAIYICIKYEKKYSSIILMIILMLIYTMLSYVKYSALFTGTFGLDIDYYYADILFRILPSLLIGGPIYVWILLLLAKIGFTHKDSEISANSLS